MIDITRPLRSGVPVWPGDTEFSFDLTWTLQQTGSVNVGRLTMSTHTGTHADAPFHFTDDGRKVAEVAPEVFVGPARVISVPGGDFIGASDLAERDLDGVSRLLIHTGSWPVGGAFPEGFCCLRPDAASFLSEKGVVLVGLDAPSVDPLESKELPAHHALLAGGAHILEGLALDGVEVGDYELISLPLRLEEADGSPVRAVLRPL